MSAPMMSGAERLSQALRAFTVEELEGEPPPQRYIVEPWIPEAAVSHLVKSRIVCKSDSG